MPAATMHRSELRGRPVERVQHMQVLKQWSPHLMSKLQYPTLYVSVNMYGATAHLCAAICSCAKGGEEAAQASGAISLQVHACGSCSTC